MISLADAGGRVMYSYKEMAELAGYTARVHELLTVFDDMQHDRFMKIMIGPKSVVPIRDDDDFVSVENQREFSLNDLRGLCREGYEGVRLDHVPIVTPSGDALVRDLSFDTTAGNHLLVTGPNGVGKSAIMRIISGLWPAFRKFALILIFYGLVEQLLSLCSC
jgi:ATP-binding cassette subfamily D (ALD) long-chain fatty acid import protein